MSLFVATQAFTLWISLIVAVGPQNALVIKQGIKREALIPVLLVCIVSDLLMIFLSLAGMGALFDRFPILIPLLRWGGIAYLLWFAFCSFREAFSNKSLEVGSKALTTKKAVKTALALTYLNPAMYVDTLVMLGSLSTHFPNDKLSLGIGCFAGTLLWFPMIGFGASALSKPLSRPRVWKWINVIIGVIIIAVALKLALA